MDIIQAWKEAKEGQEIKSQGLFYRKTRNVMEIWGVLNSGWMKDSEFILADDWEIAKEKKKVVFEDVLKCGNYLMDANSYNIANQFEEDGIPLKITAEWEE